jgi:hypothetical protein
VKATNEAAKVRQSDINTAEPKQAGPTPATNKDRATVQGKHSLKYIENEKNGYNFAISSACVILIHVNVRIVTALDDYGHVCSIFLINK